MNLPSDRIVRFTDGAILDTATVVSNMDGKRVLLVCGQHAFEASGADRCLDDLDKVVEVRRWSDFRANTDAADLIEGLRIVNEFVPDIVLGVGGGSAMDMAKLLCAYKGIDDAETLHDAIKTGAKVSQRDMRLVLAPTTSGSGSEATHFAVVYIGENKFSIAGPGMLPDEVILDPALTLSASAYQRATSGIDALAQAVESRWASGATETSREYAQAAMSVLVDALPRFVNAPDAQSARDMALGSHLAGRAIDLTKTTAAHAMSYAITKRYGLSHGHAVAMTLGEFIKFHAEADPSSLQDTVKPADHQMAMEAILAAFGATTPAAARDAFYMLARRIGLPMGLDEAGITDRERVRELVAVINVERLANNPVRLTVSQLEDLVFRCANE